MIRTKVAALIKKAAAAYDAQLKKLSVEISAPEQDRFGHYATPLALKAASIMHTAPMTIAEKLKTAIEKTSPKGFLERVEIVSPGFINLFLTNQTLQKELVEILKKKTTYGTPKKGKKEKIQLEFISANPTGPVTVANGRGGYLGDAVANFLTAAGHGVEREYYVNDTGNQIMTLGKSLLAAAGHIPEDETFYRAEYIKTWANEHEQDIKLHASDPLALGKRAAADFLKDIKNVITGKAGIAFDRFTSEDKNIHQKKLADKALSIFKRKKLVYEKDGAKWLRTTKFSDDKDRVLITSDGFPTYFLADAGHILETKQRGFTKKILILGPDHYGYVSRITAAAQILGIKSFETMVTQAVRLMKHGREISMSKRKGTFVTFEELVDEVGSDAARFFFLMNLPQTHMDFDLDLAKEHSLKNPVYYVQYAAVRVKSIINKADNENWKLPARRSLGGGGKIENLKLLATPEDISLMKTLARFPEEVEAATKKLQPNILIRYALELSHTFHHFYEKERILDVPREVSTKWGENKYRIPRLALMHGTWIVFQNCMKLLGITIPNKM